MKNKAIVLLSGGLDSILATKLMLEQGIEVEGLNFMTIFCTCTNKGCMHAATKASQTLRIPLKVISLQEEYLEIIKKPAHGYGSNMNPCIDCRLLIFKKAKEYMERSDASFIVTGEVLGERPMSQRRDAIMLIEKKAGLKGLILRPLSAKLFEPTLAEKAGIVDREKLLDIRGRSRKPQIALAQNYGINDYPCPAGGCLLTDPGFAKRMRDLIAHNALNIENAKLLKCGRHFRLSDDVKIVVGRDEADNATLESFAREGDIMFKLKYRQGPISLLRGAVTDESIEKAASIAAYHTKLKDEALVAVNFWRKGENARRAVEVRPASADEVEALRI